MSSGPLLRTLLTSRDTSRIAIRSRSPWPRSSPSSIGASGSSQRSQSSALMRQRHPVVDLGQRTCRIGGDDGAAEQRRRIGGRVLRPPGRPQPAHEQQLAVGAVHVVGRLRRLLPASVLPVGLPLVPAIHRDQAPLALGGVAECPGRGDRLGARVDQQRTLGVRPAVGTRLHPWRHQSPAHRPHAARRLVVGFGVPLHHGADGRGGRDVVVRPR